MASRQEKSPKKRAYELPFENRAFHSVSTFHATSEAEAAALRGLVPGVRVGGDPKRGGGA